MPALMRTPALVVAAALTAGLLSAPAYLQVQDKGGEEETGPYEVVPNWPQPWSQQGYIWGSQPGIFAETPNRIFIVARGELKLPPTLGRGFNGMWGSTGERATTPQAEMRNCIVVVDGNGKLIETWAQWDHLFAGGGSPHKVKISPYDADHSVWVINDAQHQIYKFSNDGKQLLMTLGEKGVAGEDDKHFGQPQDIAWLSDGSILVADGLRNARIVKLDKNGTFIGSWGSRGAEPGQLSGVHGIETDKNGKVYVADRSNRRVQIFDSNGKLLDLWPGLRQANHIVVTTDQNVWVADGTNARLLKFDPNGKLQYFWGTYGTYPGAWWELHQFAVDSDGNFYGADSFNGRVQKFRPRPGADKNKLMGQMIPLMPKAR